MEWRPHAGEWAHHVSGLALTSVSALSLASNQLLAGGPEGIAYSTDGGANWRMSDIGGDVSAVSALVPSPHFEQDFTALAGTLDDGVLRTEDGGRTWRPANFGLQSFEVTAIAWGAGDTVLTATADGIYRSPNAGRAWRAAAGSEGFSVTALTFLPDGTALAATEAGTLLRSADGGASWSPCGEAPVVGQASAIVSVADGTLMLGTGEGGLLRSLDGGDTWSRVDGAIALSLAATQTAVYAGTTDGMLESVDGGATWRSLPAPPIHDLRRLLCTNADLIVFGLHTPPVRQSGHGEWEPLTNTPLPLSAITVAPDGALFASSPEGLARSTDAGMTWHVVVPGETGSVASITFGPVGKGWAGSADGRRLLRTLDAGATWDPIHPPFGVLPLAALQAQPDALIAATFDPRQQLVQLWRSHDDGESWERGAGARTAWPIVATLGEPSALTVGGLMFIQTPDGGWKQSQIGDDGGRARRVVSDGEIILCLSTTGIHRSTDQGSTWIRNDEGLPVAQIMDIEVCDGMLYVLLSGGRVLSRRL